MGWRGQARLLHKQMAAAFTVPSYCPHAARTLCPALQVVLPANAKSPAAVAAKVVIDQLVFAPIATMVFYAWKLASEGRPG